MEQEILHWLEHRWGDRPGLRVPIGDDAAVVELPPADGLVVTTDMLVDGVHFRTREHTFEQIGRKALAVNLSDLAAMAARPLGAVVAMSLPRGADLAVAQSLIEGMQPLAEELGCPIIGGDTNFSDGPLTLAVTALGCTLPSGPLLRSGARPGDRMVVTGRLGGSLRGKHLSFIPRVKEALLLVEDYDVHGAMDISDGLSLDLSRMGSLSGVGAIVDVDRVPISDDAYEMARSAPGLSPLERALGDGEDFELLLAIPPDAARQLVADNPLDCGVTDIGEFTAEGTFLARSFERQVSKLAITGFLHGP